MTRNSNFVYNNIKEGMVASRDLQRCSTECNICGQTLQANTLVQQLESQHDVYRSKVFNQDLLVEGEPVVYDTHTSDDGIFYCPVPGCVGKATTTWTLCQHFGL